ncbi:MAG: hypothetical protein IPM42_14030 [Saprospiraceae bacterium]|nr:hypothetical protein [Saprospiraceae bacterium]
MRYNKEQIGQWVSEWEQSGLSISKYCDGKPFDKSTFYNWHKSQLFHLVQNRTINLYHFK